MAEKNFDYNFLNNTLETVIKQSIFKYFDEKLDQLEIRTINNSNWPVRPDNKFPILTTLQLISYFEILNHDVDRAIFKSAINKKHCQLKDDNSTIGCYNFAKDMGSLLRIEDMWVKLFNTTVEKESKFRINLQAFYWVLFNFSFFF